MTYEEYREQERQETKEWFLTLIKKFREEYEKLTDEEKAFIGNIGYQPPCQIEIFWVKEPIEFQIIVLTHDSTRRDMEIIINGPYKGYEFFPELEKIMKEDRWARIVPPDFPYYGAESSNLKYSDIFAGILHNFIKTIERSLFHKLHHGISWGMMFGNDGWCQLVFGLEDNLEL